MENNHSSSNEVTANPAVNPSLAHKTAQGPVTSTLCIQNEPIRLRAANSDDEEFLWLVQCHAALLESKEDPMATVRSNPVLARYVEGWGRLGDIGIIAEYEKKPVGAVWCRLFQEESPGWGWIDAETPEISVAVLPEFRQKGIGSSLLKRLLEVTGEKRMTSLAVRATNPALQLYLRLGFRVLPERNFLNRTGVLSHVMVREGTLHT